jgi:hypothetical protein
MDADTGACDRDLLSRRRYGHARHAQTGVVRGAGRGLYRQAVSSPISAIPETLAAAVMVELNGRRFRPPPAARRRAPPTKDIRQVLVVPVRSIIPGRHLSPAGGSGGPVPGWSRWQQPPACHPVIAAGVGEITHLPLPESR